MCLHLSSHSSGSSISITNKGYGLYGCLHNPLGVDNSIVSIIDRLNQAFSRNYTKSDLFPTVLFGDIYSADRNLATAFIAGRCAPFTHLQAAPSPPLPTVSASSSLIRLSKPRIPPFGSCSPIPRTARRCRRRSPAPAFPPRLSVSIISAETITSSTTPMPAWVPRESHTAPASSPAAISSRRRTPRTEQLRPCWTLTEHPLSRRVPFPPSSAGSTGARRSYWRRRDW